MLSAVVLTKNEEKNIYDCLESLSWVDEIVIIDDYSDDLTEQVVKKFSAKKVSFIKRRLEKNFSQQRNFALSKCKYEWVLFIDADERVTKQLREEINAFLINEGNSKFNGFFIPRKDVMWGRLLRHGESGNIELLRLGRKDKGKWHGDVHENWQINEPVGQLDNYILHFPHQTISEFLKEINLYTSIRADELFKKRIKSSAIKIVSYPFAKFILNYFFKLGFLDGLEGLIFAILMSMHSFLVRGKLWYLWTKEK